MLVPWRVYSYVHLVRHVASLQVEAGSPWGKRSVTAGDSM